MELAQHEYGDLMVDLETVGTGPGSAVLAIGAVLFDRKTKSIGAGINVVLDLGDQMARGLQADGSTIYWWLEQSDEARAAATKDPMNVVNALMGLAEFLTEGEGGVNKDIRVWGNGAAFDNVILREVYARYGMAAPWEHWNDRCFRTMKAEHPQGKDLEPERDSTHHNAYHDAVHQAKWAINMHHGYKVFTKDSDETPDVIDAVGVSDA